MTLSPEKIMVGVIGVIITIIVVFQLLASSATPLNTAATCIAAESATYGGLTTLFSPGGVVFLVMIAGVFLVIVGGVFLLMRRGKMRR